MMKMHIFKTNMQCQIIELKGHMGKWGELESVRSDQKHQNDGEGDRYDIE